MFGQVTVNISNVNCQTLSVQSLSGSDTVGVASCRSLTLLTDLLLCCTQLYYDVMFPQVNIKAASTKWLLEMTGARTIYKDQEWPCQDIGPSMR